MVKIYKIVDPRNKDIVRYVGKTTMSLKKRMYSHLFHGRNKRKTPLYLWINKLLIDNVIPIIELIEEVNEDIWVEKEIYWISHYKSIFGKKILNLSSGGESNLKLSPSHETKLKISLSNKGKISFWKGNKLSDEHKNNISNGGTGLKRSIETKNKISESLKDRKLSNEHKLSLSNVNNKNKKSVLKICPKTNTILNEYESIAEAIKKNDLQKVKTNLIGVCKGRGKTCGGYVWRYKN
jgi:hypothetical protein